MSLQTYRPAFGDDGARLVPVIRIPNGRTVTVPAYVAAFRAVRAADPNQRVSARSWDGFETRAGSVLRQMRNAMADRINGHIPGYGHGRKWSADWQRAAGDVAYRLNGRRIVTRERDCPPELRARLAHRLCGNDE
jgi:hypothetical protein